jgi:hypothetical protein
MLYKNERERKEHQLCIKCEAVPVVRGYSCRACYEKFMLSNRQSMRKCCGYSVRTHWDPEKLVDVPIDEREAYDAIRAKIAAETKVPGAKCDSVCRKYKITYPRIRKICREYGVEMTRKRGSGDHPISHERRVLMANVLADARSGMCLSDLKKKYQGYAVRYICKRYGVDVAKAPKSEI